MRIAAETAFTMWQANISQEEKNTKAQKILKYIQDGDELIASLEKNDRIQYGDTPASEIAIAYNRKGMALDVLYFQGYINNSEQVEEAFQEALDILIAQTGSTGTELFVRYHYSDFLVRLDEWGRHESIIKTLAPMNQMTSSHNIATFFRTSINKVVTTETWNEKQLSLPTNMRRLATISSEFKQALIGIGINEGSIIE